MSKPSEQWLLLLVALSVVWAGCLGNPIPSATAPDQPDHNPPQAHSPAPAYGGAPTAVPVQSGAERCPADAHRDQSILREAENLSETLTPPLNNTTAINAAISVEEAFVNTHGAHVNDPSLDGGMEAFDPTAIPVGTGYYIEFNVQYGGMILETVTPTPPPPGTTTTEPQTPTQQIAGAWDENYDVGYYVSPTLIIRNPPDTITVAIPTATPTPDDLVICTHSRSIYGLV